MKINPDAEELAITANTYSRGRGYLVSKVGMNGYFGIFILTVPTQ